MMHFARRVTGCVKDTVLFNTPAKYRNAIQSAVKPDVCDSHGWTALMIGARNGQEEVIKYLLDQGADRNLRNSSDQTAADIAAFWNQHNVVSLLNPKSDQSQRRSHHTLTNNMTHYFCAPNHIDRASHLRDNPVWIDKALLDPQTKFILFQKSLPVVKPINGNQLTTKGTREKVQLCVLDQKRLEKFMLKHKPLSVFLGVEFDKQNNIPLENCPAWFAVDVTAMSDQELGALIPDFEIGHIFPEMFQLSQQDSGLLSQALSVMIWIRRYKFCPRCGSKVHPIKGGYKLQCSDNSCATNRDRSSNSYPRLDPTVTMCVVSPDHTHVLLGRGHMFPPGFYSCLSGYMEPGESIEQACAREVKEESGIDVTNVTYHSSQNWPMSGSLMIGLLATATNTEIKVDTTEMASVRWFSRQEVQQMMKHQHPEGFFVPRRTAIAYHLLRVFVDQAKL